MSKPSTADRPNAINWQTSPEERRLIDAIVARANAMLDARGMPLPAAMDMDITAAHLNACRLDLQRLLDASDFDFAHDVFGITRHINRETAQLGAHFVPRAAHREGGVA